MSKKMERPGFPGFCLAFIWRGRRAGVSLVEERGGEGQEVRGAPWGPRRGRPGRSARGGRAGAGAGAPSGAGRPPGVAPAGAGPGARAARAGPGRSGGCRRGWRPRPRRARGSWRGTWMCAARGRGAPPGGTPCSRRMRGRRASRWCVCRRAACCTGGAWWRAGSGGGWRRSARMSCGRSRRPAGPRCRSTSRQCSSCSWRRGGGTPRARGTPTSRPCPASRSTCSPGLRTFWTRSSQGRTWPTPPRRRGRSCARSTRHCERE